MRRIGRWLAVGLVAAGGCRWAARPFAADPLFRSRTGAVGGPAPRPPAADPPAAPHPPPGPTIGAEAP